MSYLSLSIWLPIAAGMVLLALGRDGNARAVRWFALVASIASFLATLPLITGFDTSKAGLQFETKLTWIERFNAFYHLGVDGISVWFVLLTAFITVIVVIAGWEVITERVNQYMAAFLILSGLMIGVFAAVDGLLFYTFFEATLIPMYIIIGVWGGPNRIYASFKFFLYTLLGSLLMLVAIVYLYIKSGGSFDILTWHATKLSMQAQTLLFFAFLAAFAVKVPMFPVHTWLPDVFLRFSLPIAPDASHAYAGLIIGLSLVAVVYIGLVAMVQTDMKKLVAYSSIAHMGFCTLGFFIFNSLGMQGAIVQMISHGFVSGAMFLCIGVLYDRVHSREIAAYGGVANTMPKFAALVVLFAMANCGLPGTAGFVGEWMVIIAATGFNFWIAALAATALIFGAAYTLWMVKRVYFGPVTKGSVSRLQDINAREFLMLAVLAVAVLAMGLYPKPFTDVMQPSVDALLKHVAQSKLL
jgi:NADH-quinone oxidoreductase subunit M